MKTRPIVLVAAIAATFAYAAPRASADTILQYTGGSISQKISYNGTTSTVGGGPFTWTVNSAPASSGITAGTTIQTWCVDLFQSISSQPTDYTLTSVTSLPNSTSILNLFGEAYKTGGVVADPAAFQLALWELEYDSSPGSLTGGNFQYKGSNSTVLADAQTLVNKALYDTANGINAFAQYLNGYSLYVLESAYKQDQIVLVPPTTKPNAVPAPPAIALAFCGLFALGGRARWLRKTAQA